MNSRGPRLRARTAITVTVSPHRVTSYVPVMQQTVIDMRGRSCDSVVTRP